MWSSIAGAATITFSEPESLAVLGRSLPLFTTQGVTFTPFGDVQAGRPPVVTPRGTFDDRTPAAYPYDFIAGNVLQVSSTGLRIDLPAPVASLLLRWGRD